MRETSLLKTAVTIPQSPRLSALGLMDSRQPSRADVHMNGPFSRMDHAKSPSPTKADANDGALPHKVTTRKSHRTLRPSRSTQSLDSVRQDVPTAQSRWRAEGRGQEHVIREQPSNLSSAAVPREQANRSHKPNDDRSPRAPPSTVEDITRSRDRPSSRSHSITAGATGGVAQGDQRTKRPEADLKRDPVVTEKKQIPSNGNERAIAIPLRSSSEKQQPTIGAPNDAYHQNRYDRGNAAVAIAESHDTLAPDWEIELARGALRLGVSVGRDSTSQVGADKGKHTGRDVAREREEQRRKDAEWERSGSWVLSQDSARESEDRTRRDAGRVIGESV